jgi:hypothetical protein
METINYFKHDYRSRDDKKLMKVRMKHKMTGVGVYWSLVEMLHEGMGYVDFDLELISYQLDVEPEIVESVISLCFSIEDNKITCERVKSNLKYRMEKYNEKSEKGRAAANKRWGKNG